MCRKTTLALGLYEASFLCPFSSRCIALEHVTLLKVSGTEHLLLDPNDVLEFIALVTAAPRAERDSSYEGMYRVAEKLPGVAQWTGVEAVVLTAIGCGAFEQNPHMVASVFRQLIPRYRIGTIVFAILDTREADSVFRVFQERLTDLRGPEQLAAGWPVRSTWHPE